MHPALLIQEIVRMIMQNIGRGSYHDKRDSDQKTKTLYNAALTCSSFLEPALDALWYDMQCIKPLFKLLSNFEPNFQTERGVIWGSIPEADLKILNKYASRVRTYRWQYTDDVDVSAYIHVLRSCGRSSIFPNLAKLQISSEPEGDFTSKIMFLVSPCLRKFLMYGSSTSPHAIVLNSVQLAAPNISHLTLYNTKLDDRSISAVCLLSQLQEIIFEDQGGAFSTFDLSFFPRLSCKETLRSFSLSHLHVVWSAASLDCGTVEFPFLESINFTMCYSSSISPFAELFRYIIVPRLKELPIRLGSSPSRLVKSAEAQYWHRFFDLVGKATTNHFKTLGIQLNHRYLSNGIEEVHEQWEHVGLTVSAFPNFNNLNLETFSIISPFLCSLGRNDLTKIIHSWPNLSKLELSSCRTPELDFTALLDIAVGLPHLKYLDIPLDIVQGQINLEGIPLLAHNLRYLDLNTLVPLKDFEFLVRCIDRIFPYLKHGAFHHGNYSEWQDVSSLLFMLQSVRRDEAGRATLGITGV